MWILLNSYINQTCKNLHLKAVVINYTLVSKVSVSKLGGHILVFDKHWSIIFYISSEQ